MKTTLLFLFSFFMFSAGAQQLPVNAYKGNDTGKPLLFYISGDGGWNSFSTSLLQQMNKSGYPVVGLNARSYFWSKKKPQEAAIEINQVIEQYMKMWKIRTVVLIGYSFGADVMPFIQTRFPKTLFDSISHTVLISPSRTTDFEIHMLGMMGFKGGSGESVPKEIAKITSPVTIIYGSDENDITARELPNKRFNLLKLPGGHHFDGNTLEVATTIINAIK